MSDHSIYVKEYIQSGITVYSAKETHDYIYEHVKARTVHIPPLKSVMVGNFKITPFNVPHDKGIECYGYMIEHEDIGKLLFLTDLEYCPYNFSKQNVNHIMVEANYSKDFINIEDINRTRVLQTHMELQTTLDFISANDNTSLRNVVLLHLSDRNSDKILFRDKVQKITAASVYVAEKGLEVELSLPF